MPRHLVPTCIQNRAARRTRRRRTQLHQLDTGPVLREARGNCFVTLPESHHLGWLRECCHGFRDGVVSGRG